MVRCGSAQTLPMHLPRLHLLGNTHMFPAPTQSVGAKHCVPPMVHVPAPHVLSIAQEMFGGFEQRPLHAESVRQLNPVIEQVPVRHSVEVQAKPPLQVSPLACSGVQVRSPTGAPVSQNRPFWHWTVDVQAALAPSSA